MTLRTPALPLIPGYSVSNPNIGKTKFPRNVIFEQLDGIRIMTDKLITIGGDRINTRYPSVYTRGEVSELPGWIAFDKQVLTYDCYFQETLQEVFNSPFQIRVCKLYFFLEDGTVKVVEPKIDNSGIPQGTLINRQRINLPPPRDNEFFDIMDFNVGQEVELFGRVFKITNCDKFTRNFLNRLGIMVPDPINVPADPYIVQRRKTAEAVFAKKPNTNVDTFGQFLKYDKKVLRFYGYWDDTATEGGYVHHLTIYYFMADDTIEMTEHVKESGKLIKEMFLKRAKIPKSLNELPCFGFYDTQTVLNVLGHDARSNRYVLDPLNAGRNNVSFYTIKDIGIGSAIVAYGKKIIVTECDDYTKQYYCAKYGLDDFTPAEKPPEPPQIEAIPLHKRKLPPWNGYGTHVDSAQNCITVEPKAPERDFKKFLLLDREGMDSRILRFKARLRNKDPVLCSNLYLISYYLCDNSIAISELLEGRAGKMFLVRGEQVLPGQAVFTSEPPDLYEPHHMYIGATLNINNFIFVLLDADEYALRWMETHQNEFPKANIKLIMDKVREKIKPIYKDFVAEFVLKEPEQPVISYEILRSKLCSLMGEDWTEHEMITLARHFSAICRTERFSRAYIRRIVLTELKRYLWDDLDRFKEYYRSWDIHNCGWITKDDAYRLIRSCRLPLDVEIVKQMLRVLNKNENCEIDGQDLFNFIDRNYCPTTDVLPTNFKRELHFASEREPVAGRLIDWCAFIKELKLEHLLTERIVLKKEETEEH